MVQLTYFVWTTLWLLPITLWRWRSHQAAKTWEHTRLAIFVLELPVVFFFLGTLPHESPMTGYLLFLFGTPLLWWGYLTLTTNSKPVTGSAPQSERNVLELTPRI